MSGDLDAKALAELFDRCERVLEYAFRDRSLLETALTHASIARTRLHSNERLEFLGDAILGAIVCESLYRRFASEPEGELTRMKSNLVSRRTCAEITERLGLDELLMTGKGLAACSVVPTSVKAAVLESLVGAVYLDGGYDAALALVERMYDGEFDSVGETGRSGNFKSRLQQMSQRLHGDTPDYRLLDEKGPDHLKCFKVAAVMGATCFPAAWGSSKKQAEQHAAENALDVLEGREPRHTSD